MREKKILWIDFETTGLDERTDHPLEVAAVATDGQLNPIESFWSVMQAPSEALLNLPERVHRMHTSSGLIEEVKAAQRTKEEVDEALAAFVRRNWQSQAIIGGSSVHFDKRFLREHFPKTHALLYYRIIDVSSFMEACRISLGYDIGYNPHNKHRAYEDILQSIDLYKRYISMIKIPGAVVLEDEMLKEAVRLLIELLVTPGEEAAYMPDENTMIPRPYYIHQKVKEFLKKLGAR